MVSLPTYEELIRLRTNVIVLSRQETMLLNALCKDIEEYMIIVPKNRLNLFEREVIEFLLQFQHVILNNGGSEI